MKIIDAFTYMNEWDHLEARVEALAGLVDLHIVCEGTHTHQGEPKPLDLDGRDLPDNVVRCVAELGGYEAPWDREHAQRDFIGVYLRAMTTSHELHDDDVVLVCDVDEHVNPEVVDRIAAHTERGPMSLSMRMLFYGLDWEDAWLAELGGWLHPRALKVGDLPDSLSALRESTPHRAMIGAGWHVSYTGGPERRAAKLRAYAHAEQNNPDTHALIATAHETGIGPNGEKLSRVTDWEGIPDALVRRFR